ncbi:SDR family oxidoreductase [uncultured Roseibium sp.]|uniref:SDR family NAD(P)-dependent oxidoreductase n=1 Tax=uncultured Roseibium sp. TaxID=1936171 RepID=UPI0026167ABE|nr:SDR family oxidoreductase [uncultured Roseibium sp.]
MDRISEMGEKTAAKTIYVVGGAGGIGSAIVDRLLKENNRVLVLDLKEPADQSCAYQYVDLTRPESISTAISEGLKKTGTPQALIFSAGYLSPCAFLNLENQDIEDHLKVNLFGAFNIAQEVVNLMLEDGGRIVFISSIHGQIGIPDRGAYAMSKAALGALARAMAVELSQYKIRVNVLASGAVNAGMNPDPRSRGYWCKETPAGRVAEVEEVAQVATLLVSDQASFISGQTIAVDGGVSNLRSYS